MRWPFVLDSAEQYHAGYLTEQLEKRDDKTHCTHYMESGNQPRLNSGGASFLIPKLFVTTFCVQAAAITFPLHTARIRHPILFGPRFDLEPVRVVAHTAAVKLKNEGNIWLPHKRNNIVIYITNAAILNKIVRFVTSSFKTRKKLWEDLQFYVYRISYDYS